MVEIIVAVGQTLVAVTAMTMVVVMALAVVVTTTLVVMGVVVFMTMTVMVIFSPYLDSLFIAIRVYLSPFYSCWSEIGPDAKKIFLIYIF